MERVLTKTFIAALPQLQPLEIMGLCRILCIKVKDENNEVKNGAHILEEIIKKFDSIGRKQKRQILKMIEELLKEKKADINNGTTTEDLA